MIPRAAAPSVLATGAVFAVAAAPFAAAPSAAQETETGWSFTGELTTVVTEGNSSALTVGLGATLARVWENATWEVEAGAVRTESGTITRTAVGTEDDFDVSTDTDRRRTAENYTVKTRYDRELSEASYAYGAADWVRNTFAGLESRLILGAGAGRTLWSTETSRLRTGVGATFTFENDVVRSGSKADFPGLRANYEYRRNISETSEMESALVADLNLNDTDDLRLDWTNSLSVAVNSALALKPSLQLQWRNQPSLTEVPLVTMDGTDTGETVLTPLKKLDTQFQVALVVTL